ncbi:MAG: DUF2130 domain-containing protein [Gammaproteobacteria bacterium]|nr:DUF2130 domain-containing protein [Gammaproteobacteria bacterium]
MIEPTITCPNCSTEIKVTESLAAPLIQATRKEYEAKITEKEADVFKREAMLRDQQKEVADAQKTIHEQVAEKLTIERKSIAVEEAKKAKTAVASDLELKEKELSELQEVLDTRNAKLEEAQKAQADLIRKQRELDDEKRELDLTVEKRVQASIAEVREKAKKEAEDSLKLKVLEKEEQISSMQNKIEELKRKAEQGSQQLQGEVMELQLEDTLRSKFPFDTIEPVAKGEFGGDVIQRVVSQMGVPCGAILWESKRTKNWSDSWLAKLRGDQRTAKAEIAVLISQALPKDIESFGHVDNVWVTAPKYAFPLVMSLRQTLIQVAHSKQSQEGQQTKMALVYDYLTGPRFRHRVEAIVEKFSDMQADLDREKKTMTRLWAKRESQIDGVIESTVGMYGDLQGIAGRALQEIEGLEVPLIESDIDS